MLVVASFGLATVVLGIRYATTIGETVDADSIARLQRREFPAQGAD